MSKQSWRKVPYGTRPAKHAERKMLAEAMARLDALEPLPRWRYIGLGSLWFTDFSLFHRRLGLQLLHSIEDETDTGLQERFRNNAPFASKLHFGQTTSELPKIPWDAPAIVWMDYDNIFQSYMLQDVEHIISACANPTLVLFTMNTSPGAEENRRDQLISRLGSEDRLPVWARRNNDLDADERRGRGMANAVREIMTAQINGALVDRGEGLKYEQLFHFRYSDGAQMATFGGLVSTQGAAECHFDNLPFYRPGASSYSIAPPVLTLREGLALEADLPDIPSGPAHLPGLTRKEVEDFVKLYRYLPSFVDADI